MLKGYIKYMVVRVYIEHHVNVLFKYGETHPIYFPIFYPTYIPETGNSLLGYKTTYKHPINIYINYSIF